jgi:hypothetical protein
LRRESAQHLAIEDKLAADEFLFGIHLAHFLFLQVLVVSKAQLNCLACTYRDRKRAGKDDS